MHFCSRAIRLRGGAGGSCEHNFLLHVPCETLGFPVVPFFLQREHDSQLAILDLNFSVLRGAFGAVDPMVRRTIDFPATKSGLETN